MKPDELLEERAAATVLEPPPQTEPKPRPERLPGGRRTRPNVLFILIDQLRYDVFSHRGNRIIQTPNIDRLASEGFLLSDATCSTPLCGPSRASILSGCFSRGRKFEYRNCEPEEKGLWLKDISTVDEALARAGYHVEYHGKWHTGREHRSCYKGDTRVFAHRMTDYHAYLAERYPNPPDDAEHKIDRYTKWPYRYWPVDEMMAAAKKKGFLMPHHNEAGVIEVSDQDTMTAWTVRKTINFLRSRPPTPFCVTCSILQPHAPLIANAKYARMFDPAVMPMPPNVTHSFQENPPIPGAVPADASGLGQFMALYYGLVKELDDWVGWLLAALDEQGLTDETLIIFTADHGEMMGSHRTFSKMKFFEECLRVPLILRWPGVIPADRQSSAPASGADIAPTILDYCGIPPLRQFDGRSLRPVIEGASSGDDYAYSEHRAGQCLRSTAWKYVVVDGQRPRLFDLQNDPYEMLNLLDQQTISHEIFDLKAELDDRLATEFKKRPLPPHKKRR